MRALLPFFLTMVTALATPIPATGAPFDPSPFGIISDDFGDPVRRQLAADAGYKWLRLWIIWDRLEPGGMDQSWTENVPPVLQEALDKYDDAVNGAIASGFSILGIIHGTPHWAGEPDDGTCLAPVAAGSKPPTSPDYFEKFTRRLAERYGDRIAAWELWNEPKFCTYWSGTKEQYRKLILAPGYDGIKSAQPDALVMAPALGGVTTKSDFTPWLKQDGVLVRPIDAVSVHSFNQWNDTKIAMNAANQFAAEESVSKYWVTAFGFATSPEAQDVCPKASVNNPGNRIVDVLSKCEDQANCERTFYFVLDEKWFVDQELVVPSCNPPDDPPTCDVALIEVQNLESSCAPDALIPRPKYYRVQDYTGVIPSQCSGQPNGTACSDGDVCNGTERCQMGVCMTGVPLVCNDGDPCTVDECVAGSGCDTTPVVCDDGDPCTVDECVPLSGCTTTKDIGLPECVPTWLPAVLSILDGGCGDSVLDPGEQCDDGNTIAGDCCSPTCQVESCDDGNPCTTDVCQAGVCVGILEPEIGCREARRGSVQLKDRSPDTKDKFSWKWLFGPATSADFGDPAAGLTSYDLCIYDTMGGTSSLAWHASIPGGGLCSGRPCWQAAGGNYRFSDQDGAFAGITRIILKAGTTDNAKILVKGKGVRLGLPVLPLVQDPTVTVQLKSTDGECWTTPYDGPPVRNDVQRFKDTYRAGE